METGRECRVDVGIKADGAQAALGRVGPAAHGWPTYRLRKNGQPSFDRVELAIRRATLTERGQDRRELLVARGRRDDIREPTVPGASCKLRRRLPTLPSPPPRSPT